MLLLETLVPMAKYGEGDKRWIVAERADGRNVHNWHWVERDCLQWSRSFLSSLLSDLTIVEGHAGIFIRTTNLEKLEGEAYINVRKGRAIPGYELSFSLSFEAEAISDSDGREDSAAQLLHFKGSVEIPFLGDENADEDPEVKFVLRDGDGPIGRRIKDAFIAKGKPAILQKIRSYVQAMSNGGPAKDDLEAGKVPSVEAPLKIEKEGFKTIRMIERFNCRATDVYEILMDEKSWKGFTHSNARINKEIEGQFSLIDGSITGVNEELQEGRIIVQKWRFSSWADGIHSTVRLDFDEPDPGVAIVKLTQNGVPEVDRFGNSSVIENTERCWRELIFHQIRTLFGFEI